MATHMQHEDDFVTQMVQFVQPHIDNVGITFILRLGDGNFVHQTIEMPERMFHNDQGVYDNIVHEELTKILAVARQGPGSFVVPDFE